jgi:hypothetical protein
MTMRCVSVGVLVAASVPSLASAQPFEGRVQDAVGAPVAGAHVTVNHAGRADTDVAGLFSVDTPRVPAEDVVVATREGLLSRRLVVDRGMPPTGLVVDLDAYPADLDGFLPEGPNACGRCHRPYVDGWGEGAPSYAASAHATSALNPRVLDIWRGTASGHADAASCASVGGRWTRIRDELGTDVERCYVGVGLLPDMNPQCGHEGQPPCDDRAAPVESRPTSFSDCAPCHTPGAAIRIPEELDLDVAEASPVAMSVTCAGCHRIAAVLDPNAPGVLTGARVIRGETALAEPLGLGPLDDAAGAEMASGYAPVFATSALCAPCHQDTYVAAGMSPRWAPAGVPSEQTYAEWLETPYASGPREAQCQGCHMPSLEALGVTPARVIVGDEGPPRETSEIHSHLFSALTDDASRAEALGLEVEATMEGGELVVRASVENRGVGHGWPSGVTSRNAVLVVDAELAGVPLEVAGGDALPLYAGSYAHGTVVGADAAGRLTLDRALDESAVGRTLRLWVDTDEPHEHVGWGLFRALPPEERGLFRARALGELRITAVRGAEIDVSGTVSTDAVGASWAVGDDARLAGAPGLGFAKVNIAADGTPNVPFWRATDVVSDNRIAPDETQRAEHRFVVPPGATGSVRVRARLLYRRAFVDLAAQRGWDGNETLAREASTSWELAPPDAGAVDGGAADAGPGSGPSSCACRVSGGHGGRGHAATGLGVLVGALSLALARIRRREENRR